MKQSVIIPAGTFQKNDTIKFNLVMQQKHEHLFHFLPFLKNEYRLLKKEELNSEETFKELFPGEEIDLTKLEQIFEFQKVEMVKEKTKRSKETFDLYYPENEVQ